VGDSNKMINTSTFVWWCWG